MTLLPEAELPSLPEQIEAWISSTLGLGYTTVVLYRRATARFARVATWQATADPDLGQWVIDRVRNHAVEHGDTVFRLERIGKPATGEIAGDGVAKPPEDDEPRADWRCKIAEAREQLPRAADLSDGAALLNMSWQLTFKAASLMLDNLSVVPRSLREIGDLHRTALDMARANATQSEASTVAAIESDASTQKLEQILGFVRELSGTGASGPLPITGSRDESAKTATAVRQLLAAFEPEERSTVLATKAGGALVTVERWLDAKKLIDELMGSWSRGEFTVSDATKERVRGVIRAINR